MDTPIAVQPWMFCAGPLALAAIVYLVLLFLHFMRAPTGTPPPNLYINSKVLQTRPDYQIIGAAELVNQRTTGRERGAEVDVYYCPDSHEAAAYGAWVEQHGAAVGVQAHKVSAARVAQIYKGKGRDV